MGVNFGHLRGILEDGSLHVFPSLYRLVPFTPICLLSTSLSISSTSSSLILPSPLQHVFPMGNCHGRACMPIIKIEFDLLYLLSTHGLYGPQVRLPLSSFPTTATLIDIPPFLFSLVIYTSKCKNAILTTTANFSIGFYPGSILREMG